MPALILPATLLVLLMMVAPMVLLFRYSLNLYSPTELMIEAFTARNYLSAVTDSYYREVMGTTLQVAFFSTLIALTAGFPAAYALARMRGRWKAWLTLLTVFPLMVGNVVRAAGWMTLLGNTGVVNAGLRATGLLSGPVQLMYTPGAVVAGIVTVVLPYMILTLSSVIEGIPRNVEEAAQNMGARPFTVFRRIIFPLALPGVVAGSALVFILCMNAYATPVLLGGAQFKMMAPAVYDQFVRTTNWPFGAALAFILLAVTLGLTVAGSALLQRRYRR
ncbi:ABC transporter permease [Limobrevibacterium gyesilva]|uniref:ABC transporter permease n=1 Tax=Limobrevibacterium gyesilva TaxID=2991712 RepID=A0AA41YJB7_9PROT|nr:ABC transporter permease [Limobrevibacterium gyesilva]MCW3474234.1 ABC transporter permease [Limobrevibacterium gyesilva]